MAIEIFKNMKSCGIPPNAATYNIMIDCCTISRCFKSACALVSMMVGDGFYLQTLAYTTLIKVVLTSYFLVLSGPNSMWSEILCI